MKSKKPSRMSIVARKGSACHETTRDAEREQHGPIAAVSSEVRAYTSRLACTLSAREKDAAAASKAKATMDQRSERKSSSTPTPPMPKSESGPCSGSGLPAASLMPACARARLRALATSGFSSSILRAAISAVRARVSARAPASARTPATVKRRFASHGALRAAGRM